MKSSIKDEGVSVQRIHVRIAGITSITGQYHLFSVSRSGLEATVAGLRGVSRLAVAAENNSQLVREQRSLEKFR